MVFGNKYRIGMDESWDHSQGDRINHKKWFEQVLCAKGAFIYLYSENPTTFALYMPRIRKANLILDTIPGLKADMLDGEAVIFFGAEHFDKVAKLAGVRRKRKLTEEQKTRLSEAGKDYRFSGKSCGAGS